MNGLGQAPSVALPLSYLLTASGAFLLAALSIPLLARELAGFYYHPALTALTHMVTLGWITLTIMGSSFQLAPILLERRLWSERLAVFQFWIMVAGIMGMVGHFALARWNGLAWGAGLVGIGVVCYLVNLGLSLRPSPRWTATACLFVLALGGLFATLIFGLLLALDRNRPFLPGPFFATIHAHFHLAFLGWVSAMILGVAARILPMFLLAEEPKGWGVKVQVGGIALGVPGVTLSLLTGSHLLPAAALAVAAAAVAFILQTLTMVRRRRRPRLDWGLKFVVTGTAFLAPTAVLGLGFAFGWIQDPGLATTYAILGLGGWTSLTIAGMLLKIVPFQVWYLAYGGKAGRQAVPALPELSWPLAEQASYWLLTVGIIALALAAARREAGMIRLAGIVLAAGAGVLVATLLRIAGHLPATRRIGKEFLKFS